ncbi:response regulator transcription factor [Anaeromyxobacter oryzae]|uniref:DNA-binding response regulator n=1 Tax=Anaeromyxobacter oryzae TaxID=2918170 RepID=A0ABM7X0B6_9BACT|nr:response regulator transcription factor [Anaeromyxobacter oryzae]BDG05167.1 DNA-binding response regulator [Anaeromyxobacter oryzae]
MRILLIDHDERTAIALAKRLGKETYAVDVIACGDDAEEQAEVVSYDVIIVHAARGLELCRTLRLRGVAAPILMLTAGSSAAERVACLDGGADDCVVDTVPAEELLARIRALLRRGPGARVAPVLRVHDLTLDVASRDVRRGDRPVRLTAKEQAILEFLMRHEGEVVTRVALAEHVWASEHDNLTNLVDVHMSNLRRKIDGGAAVTLLRTVRGLGYRLGPAPE